MFDKQGNKHKHPIWKVKTDSYEDTVSELWTNDNFDKKIIDKIINLHKGKYVVIKAGNVNQNDAFNDYNNEPAVAPKIIYKQNQEKYCLACSWANTVSCYLGHAKETKELADFSQKWLESLDYQELIKATNQKLTNYCAIEIDTNYDPVHEIHEQPTLLVLKSSDGGVGHAVGTCGHWLFDSNLDCAKYISKELLDWCVSTNSEKCFFTGIYWGMRLHRNLVQKEENTNLNINNSVAQFFWFCLRIKIANEIDMVMSIQKKEIAEAFLS